MRLSQLLGLVLVLLVALCCWRKSTAAYDDAVHARRKRFVTETAAQPYEGQHPSGSYRMLAVSTDVHGSLQKVLQTHIEENAEEQYKEKVARRHRALSAMIRSGAGGSTFFDPSNIPETVSEDGAAGGGEEEPGRSGGGAARGVGGGGRGRRDAHTRGAREKLLRPEAREGRRVHPRVTAEEGTVSRL